MQINCTGLVLPDLCCRDAGARRHLKCNRTKLNARLALRQMAYIGETKRTLRERFSEHRQATNNPLHANAAAAVPFHFTGHSITDMGLIPLELQPTPSASRQKAREAYLIHRGQTISPDGINRRNEH